MNPFKIALIQMNSGENKAENLQQAERLIQEAAAGGADMVALPEVFNVIDPGITPPEEVPNGASTKLLIELAKKHRLYIHNGSLGEADPAGGKKFNTSLVINPEGEIIGKYQKLHLFDVDLPDGTKKRESDRIQAGNKIVTVDTPLGKLGLTICYDIRFPELYRLLAMEGAEIIFAPANFTMITGKDHWEAILKTRAIENTVFMVAPNQIGTKYGHAASFGSSMVIDPWGTVIARAPERIGVAYATIDLNDIRRVRNLIPSLNNRRSDVYSLKKQTI